MTAEKYTEGIYGDSAVILKDGEKITISEILGTLNKYAKTKKREEKYLKQFDKKYTDYIKNEEKFD